MKRIICEATRQETFLPRVQLAAMDRRQQLCPASFRGSPSVRRIPSPKYKLDFYIHTSFSSPDADIVLISRDNVHFRIHSQLLRQTSGWFRTLLSLPNNAPQAGTPDALRLDEPSSVLDALLRIASAMEVPPLRPVDFCEEVLLAAEKYEMPGPASVVRVALTSSLLDAPPVRVYGIATRRGWVAEARAASARTLALDLFHPALRADMDKVDAPHLMALLRLHHARKQALREVLDDKKLFSSSTKGTTQCFSCGRRVDHIDWFQFKYNLLVMATVPSDTEILNSGDLQRVLEASCLHCNKTLYGAVTTRANLGEALKRLPTSVDLS
ncbi:hypothetical protein OBBRIDRAFT_192562 [Obba rivulosa]|uniref:BTB domain-containing protein n=1 Tax=Obba rivulosa TaxID=1052685 RepID=A0A8E2AS09_9APHY|nr:hypothetical protein OBBRIDRAFT_192562 [Obba rivulosa]